MAVVIVWEPGTFGHYWGAFKTWVRKRLRSKIFDAIERDDRRQALKLATSKVLRAARNEFGQRPVAASISANRMELAVELIDCGGYVRGDGAVALAAMGKNVTVHRKLIEIGADVDEPLPTDPMEQGWTPLMWATNRHHFETMKLLLTAGANINAVARDGTTAVMCTSAGRDDDLVALDMLCSHRPELTVKDWRGRTILDEARDRARFSQKPAMQEILMRHFPELQIAEA